MIALPRRRFCLIAGTGLLAPALLPRPGLAQAPLAALVGELERSLPARIGVAIRGPGLHFAHRAAERFPMCSTFKALLAGAILARVDAGQERLARTLIVQPADIVAHAPVTEQRLGAPGMSLAELCHAAVTRSDNTAANLLLDSIDGPAGFTAWLRSLGDATTRLDRRETALNEATPGDPRDTTTPAAMVALLDTLLLGTALSAPSRQQLMDWMLANTTSDDKLRAGVPAGWRVADRTGGGGHGTMNDVGLLLPPDAPPMLIAIFITETTAETAARAAAIAAIAKAATQP